MTTTKTVSKIAALSAVKLGNVKPAKPAGVVVPAMVQDGYAAGMGMDYTAHVYRQHIVAARGKANMSEAIEAVHDAYRIGLMASLHLKKSFKVRPAGKDFVCSTTAYEEALAMHMAGKAAREKAGWQDIYKQANTRLWLIRESAGIDKDGLDKIVKEKGTDDAKHEGAKDVATSKGAGKRASEGKATKSDKETTTDDLNAFLASHKPADAQALELVALTLGKNFGFMLKGNPKLFTGNPRVEAIGAAMTAFHQAMLKLPVAE